MVFNGRRIPHERKVLNNFHGLSISGRYFILASVYLITCLCLASLIPLLIENSHKSRITLSQVYQKLFGSSFRNQFKLIIKICLTWMVFDVVRITLWPGMQTHSCYLSNLCHIMLQTDFEMLWDIPYPTIGIVNIWNLSFAKPTQVIRIIIHMCDYYY